MPGNKLSQLPVGAIKPQGWLLEQLKAQADGLTGQLFDIWPDVGENCGWLGGDGDAWERAPYYLDGLLPLAHQLEDERLLGIANRFIEWTLHSQQPSGWFGPESNDDWWPRMVMLKVLEQHFTATGDKRVLTFMDKYFRYQLQELPNRPLKDWACARGGENMRSALFLYNITGMNYLLKLCRLLKEQTLDWTSHFHIFPHIRPMQKQRPWNELEKGMQAEPQGLTNQDSAYYHKEFHLSHGVNVAMALKTPGVINAFKSGFKEVAAFKVGWGKLMRHHGVASGIYTCDEHLSGASPTQGSELCTVVEMMYTLETLIGLGDEFGNDLPDILEKLAFNALPATNSADMMLHQYDQQANQVKVSNEPRPWYNNNDDANLFGLEPNFGCCTANLHQGWPKFVSSLWYATSDEGLAAISYAPCSVNFMAGGQRVRLNVGGCYPFGEDIRIEVNTKRLAEFPLYLRIPGWAQQAMIRLPDGELMQLRAGETACVRRKWMGTETVTINLPMEPRISRWFHQSAAVEMGALTMCLRPEEKWTKLDEQNWGIEAASDWNYALIEGESMKPVFDPDKAGAFKTGDPVRVLVKALKLPEWGMEGANAAQPPISPRPEGVEPEVIELVPFGNSSLRISQFPLSTK
ncbi:glycoside hydrolase family 127 protein [Eubacteriales bacterium OttesenSCG-928-N13]|nr:glycoside hydrolase family 127 protein [Eubacteriales bacterium OttesenSCG-928-N13]